MMVQKFSFVLNKQLKYFKCQNRSVKIMYVNLMRRLDLFNRKMSSVLLTQVFCHCLPLKAMNLNGFGTVLFSPNPQLINILTVSAPKGSSSTSSVSSRQIVLVFLEKFLCQRHMTGKCVFHSPLFFWSSHFLSKCKNHWLKGRQRHKREYVSGNTVLIDIKNYITAVPVVQ